MCLRHQAVYNLVLVTGQLCPASGKVKGITLSVCHRLQWFIHLRAHGLRKEDEHPSYTPHGVWLTLGMAEANTAMASALHVR